MTARVQPTVGAVDWQHPAWQDSFYPDTLPADWQLAFYANEFLTVLVPQHRWLDLAAGQCEQWLAEVGDNFRLFLDCQLDSEQTVVRLLRTFTQPRWPAPRLGGLLVRTANGEFLAEVLTNSARLGCQLVVGYSGDELTSRGGQALNCLWRPGRSRPVPVGGIISVGLIDQTEIADDRALRNNIEDFMRRGGEDVKEAYLFIAGTPPNPGLLHRATVIGQLL